MNGGKGMNQCWLGPCAATFVIISAFSAKAQDTPTNLQIVVGHEAGTGFDLYARTLARYFPAHLPGKPTVVVQNMVGASGLTAFNWLANVAPKDGSVIATAVFTVPFELLLGNADARFNASKLTWIGNMDSSVSICGVSKSSGLQSFDDVLKRETLVGSTGNSGPLSQSPRALNALLGTRFKVIEGYKGSASVKLAIERGEGHGVCGISLSTVKTQYRDVRDSGAFHLILQIGPAPHPDIKEVPHVYDYARTDEDRAVFDVLFGAQGLGRSFVAPPAVSAERTRVLREGFDATLRDAAFVKEAEKIGLDIRPQSGAEVQKFIDRVYAASPDVAARARKVLGR